MDLSEDLIYIIRKAVAEEWELRDLLEKAQQCYNAGYATEQRLQQKNADAALRWIYRNKPGHITTTRYRARFVKHCTTRLHERAFNQVMKRAGYVHKPFKRGFRWRKDAESESENDESSDSDPDSDPEYNLEYKNSPVNYVFVISVPAYTENVVRIDTGDAKTIGSYDPSSTIYAKVRVSRSDECLERLLKKFERKFTLIDGNDTFGGDLGEMMIEFNRIVADFQ